MTEETAKTLQKGAIIRYNDATYCVFEKYYESDNTYLASTLYMPDGSIEHNKTCSVGNAIYEPNLTEQNMHQLRWQDIAKCYVAEQRNRIANDTSYLHETKALYCKWMEDALYTAFLTGVEYAKQIRIIH